VEAGGRDEVAWRYRHSFSGYLTTSRTDKPTNWKRTPKPKPNFGCVSSNLLASLLEYGIVAFSYSGVATSLSCNTYIRNCYSAPLNMFNVRYWYRSTGISYWNRDLCKTNNHVYFCNDTLLAGCTTVLYAYCILHTEYGTSYCSYSNLQCMSPVYHTIAALLLVEYSYQYSSL
jgi:hypothetical protein